MLEHRHPPLPAPGRFLSAPSSAQAHPAGAEEIVMGGVGWYPKFQCVVCLWLGVSAPGQGVSGKEGGERDFKDREWTWQEAQRLWWVLVPQDSRHLITPK